MLGPLLIAAGAVAGLFAGWLIAGRRSRATIAEARDAADRIREESQRQVALTHREREAREREVRLEIEQSFEVEREKVEQEIARAEQVLERKAARLTQQETQLNEREAALDERFQATRAAKHEARDVRQQAKECRRAMRGKLEERAEQTAEALKQRAAERLIEETRSGCADRLRNLESAGSEEFARQAKRVMGIAMNRYVGHCPRERATMTMQLPEGAAEKLRGALAPHVEKLTELTSVGVLISDEGGSIRLESGDGVARELCRRVITRMLKDGGVADDEQLVTSLRGDLERELHKTGRKAFKQLSLKVSGDEVVDLVGKLNYRTSYTQNQWRHAIEAAHLAGMMASELRMDAVRARRGALMHDIGKALTHELDGSHALIGAEIALRSGEDELVANAIAHHHGEQPSMSALAPLVAAADAMSGARPGARRAAVESYSDRVGDLEKIASSFAGVMSVHAAQAGRELRVHVDDRKVGENDLDELSTKIAESISEQMTFPGQIRVTVIREFCAVATAN